MTLRKNWLRNCLKWVGLFVVLLFLTPVVIKFGYLHRWWGKDSLVMRSLWLCEGSPEFEQSLYPENVEVLVSACECEGQRVTRAEVKGFRYMAPYLLVSACDAPHEVEKIPGGRLLFVDGQLINLFTGTREYSVLPGKVLIWVTEDLLWYEDKGDNYLFLRSEQLSIPLNSIQVARPELLSEEGVIDLNKLVEALKGSQQICNRRLHQRRPVRPALHYDHANRLIAVSGQPSAVSFEYNGSGDRLMQTVNGQTTRYTLDLNAGLTQVLSDGTNTYLYGRGRIAQLDTDPLTTDYFLTDALGSVRQLADSSGNVTLAQNYQPYGETLSSAGDAATPTPTQTSPPSGTVIARQAVSAASNKALAPWRAVRVMPRVARSVWMAVSARAAVRYCLLVLRPKICQPFSLIQSFRHGFCVLSCCRIVWGVFVFSQDSLYQNPQFGLDALLRFEGAWLFQARSRAAACWEVGVKLPTSEMGRCVGRAVFG